MFKGECSKDKFKLEHNHPEDFTRCFWQKQQRVLPIWLAYRVVLVVIFLTGFVVIFFQKRKETDHWYTNFIFYTYWCYLLQLTTFTLALAVTVHRFRKEKKYPELPPMEKMPHLYKALWVFYTVAAPCSVVVATIFWLFIFSPTDHPSIGYTLVTEVSNCVFMLLDFFLYAIPYRFLHFYMPIIYCFIYGLFSLFYKLSGGTGLTGLIPMYNIMDWRNPTLAVSTCTIQLACLLLVHAAFCVLSVVKHWIKKPSDAEVPA